MGIAELAWQLIGLETALHLKSIRQDRERLNALLHDEFAEIDDREMSTTNSK